MEELTQEESDKLFYQYNPINTPKISISPNEDDYWSVGLLTKEQIDQIEGEQYYNKIKLTFLK